MRSDDPYFRVDANLLAALPRVIHRANGFSPRIDLSTLLALHACADSLPSSCRTVSEDAVGLTTLRTRYRPSALLETMGHRRDRVGRRDFSSDAWRTLRSSIRRLTAASVSIPYTVLDRDGHWRTATRHLSYEGPVVLVDKAADGRRFVHLPVAGGLLTGFFVSIGRDVFDLRADLGEVDTRVLVWLLRQHRGRTKTQRRRRVLVHRSVLELDAGDVAAQLGLHGGHPSRGRAAVLIALRRLEDLEVLGLDERDGATVVVELLSDVFRSDGGWT